MFLFGEVVEGLDDISGCLDQLNQNSISGNWRAFITFWMDESNVVTSCPRTNPTRRKSNPFLFHPFDSYFKIIDPQADVIERGHMDLGNREEQS